MGKGRKSLTAGNSNFAVGGSALSEEVKYAVRVFKEELESSSKRVTLYARDMNDMAKSALRMVGTEKVRLIAESPDIRTIMGALSQEKALGGDKLARLRMALGSGKNRPLNTSDMEWAALHNAVTMGVDNLRSKGITIREIAAYMQWKSRFDATIGIMDPVVSSLSEWDRIRKMSGR